MLLTLLLLQAAAATAEPPADWAMLAALPYAEAPQVTPALTRFVAGEVAAGRCPQQRATDGHHVVRLDLAALVAAPGRVARIVPRAINCPTVEQYGVGLVERFARDNLQAGTGVGAAQWYRATLVFDWAG